MRTGRGRAAPAGPERSEAMAEVAEQTALLCPLRDKGCVQTRCEWWRQAREDRFNPQVDGCVVRVGLVQLAAAVRDIPDKLGRLG